MNYIQPTLKSSFSLPVIGRPQNNSNNPFIAKQGIDSFNGKPHFGAAETRRQVTANTHTLGRLDTFI